MKHHICHMSNDISLALSKILNSELSITRQIIVGGGSINKAYKIETSAGDYFIKENDAVKYPDMFEAEADGLQILKKHTHIQVPDVYGTTVVGSNAYIALEFLQSGNRNDGFWSDFGSGLAQMHRESYSSFGLGHDNYIGSLKQQNKAMSNWTGFLIERRFEPQLELARNSGKADKEMVARFHRLFSKLPQFFQDEPPSLLHGDLWSGNFLVGQNGQPAILDPAVYYGHRLMDIGMSQLFGGFDEDFYDAYQDEWPLQDNWQNGVEVANLYPLLVHVNLFGGGYLSQVIAILKKYA